MKIRLYLEGNFKSIWLSRYINSLSYKGKNFLIEKLIYSVFYFFKKCFNIHSIFFLFEALERLKPVIGLKLHRIVKSKRKKIYAYPVIINNRIRHRKAMYWLIKSVKRRKELSFLIKMNKELENILFNEMTESIRKKKEYYNHAILFKSVKKF